MDSEVTRPLCVYCIASVSFAAARIEARVSGDSAIAVSPSLIEGGYLKPGINFLNHLSGNVRDFVALLRNVEPFRTSIAWLLNADWVGSCYAEFEYFGCKVCAVHLSRAMEDWQLRYNSNRRITGW